MIYHSLWELIFASLYFLLYGIFSSCIYISQSIIISWIIDIFKIPLLVLSRGRINFKNNNPRQLKEGVSDLIYFLICGAGYIILQYIALDGAFRIFFLIIFLFGFFVSKKSIGLVIKKALSLLLGLVYKAIFYICRVALFPLGCIIHIALKLFSPLLRRCKERLLKFRKEKAYKKRKNKKAIKQV